VAIGITTSIAEIVQGGFQDKQVIIVDRSPERTRFLYNTLQSMYKEDMQVIQAVVVERSAEHSTGEGTVTSERPGSNTENRNPNEGNPDQAIGDAEDYDDGDGEEPSGISLHSQDTHYRGGELEGASTDSSNEEYHPKGTSVWHPISPEYVSSEEEEDEEAGGPQEGQEHCTDFVRRIVEQVFGGEDVEPVISTENTVAPQCIWTLTEGQSRRVEQKSNSVHLQPQRQLLRQERRLRLCRCWHAQQQQWV
jgi:hypothetical protein